MKVWYAQEIFTQNIRGENACYFRSLKYIFCLIQHLKLQLRPVNSEDLNKERIANSLSILRVYLCVKRGSFTNITTTQFCNLFLITNSLLLTLLLTKSNLMFFIQVPNGLHSYTAPMYGIENDCGVLKN